GSTLANAGTIVLKGSSPLGNSSAVAMNGALLIFSNAIVSSPVVVSSSSIEMTGGGSSELQGGITLNNDIIIRNEFAGSGGQAGSSLTFNGGVVGSSYDLQFIDNANGDPGRFYLTNTPINLGSGELRGFGVHVGVPGNVVGVIHPHWGRRMSIEVDNAFAGAPALSLGNPSWGRLDLKGHDVLVSSLANANLANTPDEVTSSVGSGTLTVSNNAPNSFSGILTGSGLGLTKTGPGSLTLVGTNTFGVATTVLGGTLAQIAPAGAGTLIPNSSLIDVASGGVFHVAGVVGGFQLQNGQTLQGNGVVVGPVTTLAGSTLAPGASTGTLNFTSTLTLAGDTLMEIQRNATPTNDLVQGVTTLTYGGTLTVVNSGMNALLGGEVFQLFSASTYTGAFTTTNLPALGGGLTWDTSGISVDGTITVVAPPAPFRPVLTDIHLLSTETVSLTWTSTNTQHYTLQKSTDLTGGLWGAVPPHTNMPGFNGTMTVNTPVTSSALGLFRVLAESSRSLADTRFSY
ncbi:MAG: hypothetical protein ACYTHJ_22885, partial [Planctomycetota bacterium]